MCRAERWAYITCHFSCCPRICGMVCEKLDALFFLFSCTMGKNSRLDLSRTLTSFSHISSLELFSAFLFPCFMPSLSSSLSLWTPPYISYAFSPMLIPLSFPLSFLTVLSCMWHTPVPQPSFALIRSSGRDGERGRAAGKAGEQTAKQTRAPHSSTHPRIHQELYTPHLIYSSRKYQAPKTSSHQTWTKKGNSCRWMSLQTNAY